MSKGSGEFDRDILDIIPERYDDDADSRQARAGHRLRTIVTMGLAVAAVGGIVAAGLHFVGSKPGGGPGIPVIKADDRPIKTRPDDRGGMQVPNQDKLVYGRIGAGEGGESRVERLLPSPEQPIAPPAPEIPVQADKARPASATEILRPPPGPAAAKTEPPSPKPAPQTPVTAQPLEPSKAQPVAEAAKAPPPVADPPKAQPVAEAVKPAESVQPIDGRTPVPVASTPAAPVQKTEQKQVAALPAAAPPSGDWLIQLGALRAQDLAEREWNRIKTANADLLGALKPTIVRVDLGDKGTFWRLRAGPLSEQAAKQLCGQLKERNQGCIIAR